MFQLSWCARISRLDPTPGITPSIPMVKGNFTCGTVGIREQYGRSIKGHTVHLYFWAIANKYLLRYNKDNQNQRLNQVLQCLQRLTPPL